MIRFSLPRPPGPAVLPLSVLMLVGGATSGGGLVASGEPMVVTSDTPAYCSALSTRIAARGELPSAVCVLRREGDALCARGQVRTGIRQLRRALLALDAEGRAPMPTDGVDAAEDCR